MKNVKGKYFKNEAGLTLTEVLASIVLISIVIFLFSMIFLNFMDTLNKLEKVISATYVAQKEMERMYEFSKMVPITKIEDSNDFDYTKIETDGEWTVYKKEEEHYDIRLKIKKLATEENENIGLVHVFIEIHDLSTDKLETEMENFLDWKEDES